MLKDTTRTISYAKFILSNPQVFKDAIVMDVGCGTGILSSKSRVQRHKEGSETQGGMKDVETLTIVFAAKAGAKQVFAIEASGLAGKARENIKNNGLDKVITFVHINPCSSSY